MITVLFWPCMISSLILSILALSYKKPKLFVYASVLILPLSLYLSVTPAFEVWGLIFPFFFIGAAVIIRKYTIWLSVLLISPNFLLVGWLGFIVLNQH